MKKSKLLLLRFRPIFSCAHIDCNRWKLDFSVIAKNCIFYNFRFHCLYNIFHTFFDEDVKFFYFVFWNIKNQFVVDL